VLFLKVVGKLSGCPDPRNRDEVPWILTERR